MAQPVDAPTPQSLADLVARCDQINRYETQLTAAEESRVARAARSEREVVRKVETVKQSKRGPIKIEPTLSAIEKSERAERELQIPLFSGIANSDLPQL